MSFSAASLHAVLEVLIPEGAAGFVVALSGGADSAALLGAMCSLEGNLSSQPLRAVHIDHGLQAAASEFRDACTLLCKHLSVPLQIISVTVSAQTGASVEAAARDARYAALAAALAPKECLLTAHHRKDQAETLLLQALRGAGVKGMAAMPGRRVLGLGWHVRPVLDVPQGELLEFGARFAGAKSLDPMNQDVRFDRSYLRNTVWPMIEARWPGAEAALSRTARHMAEAQSLLDSSGAADLVLLRDGEALSVPGLRVLPQLRRMNAVRLWLREASVEAPSAMRLTEALRQIFDAQEDHLPAIVWGDSALRRYRSRLFVTAAHPPRLQEPRRWEAMRGSSVELGPNLGRLTWVAHPGGISGSALPRFVTVRHRDGGETLKPAKSASTQSVQHLFQTRGVLPWLRDALPLVFAGDALIAVADLWMDARWCARAGEPGLAIEWFGAPIIC
ncbi:MAG TPA: tRNA lysidine(34) synthetase TilS [Steroidobacteraceae bacterium]|jgi:tRNA(Ile)-lysidine synthase